MPLTGTLDSRQSSFARTLPTASRPSFSSKTCFAFSFNDIISNQCRSRSVGSSTTPQGVLPLTSTSSVGLHDRIVQPPPHAGNTPVDDRYGCEVQEGGRAAAIG